MRRERAGGRPGVWAAGRGRAADRARTGGAHRRVARRGARQTGRPLGEGRDHAEGSTERVALGRDHRRSGPVKAPRGPRPSPASWPGGGDDRPKFLRELREHRVTPSRGGSTGSEAAVTAERIARPDAAGPCRRTEGREADRARTAAHTSGWSDEELARPDVPSGRAGITPNATGRSVGAKTTRSKAYGPDFPNISRRQCARV
jgi:hypothetical protein